MTLDCRLIANDSKYMKKRDKVFIGTHLRFGVTRDNFGAVQTCRNCRGQRSRVLTSTAALFERWRRDFVFRLEISFSQWHMQNCISLYP